MASGRMDLRTVHVPRDTSHPALSNKPQGYVRAVAFLDPIDQLGTWIATRPCESVVLTNTNWSSRGRDSLWNRLPQGCPAPTLPSAATAFSVCLRSLPDDEFIYNRDCRDPPDESCACRRSRSVPDCEGVAVPFS